MTKRKFKSKRDKLPVVVISPEAYGLPEEMDPMAQYVTRRGGGGLGDITRGILNGLYNLNIEGYYIGPNYKTIFKENSGLSHEEYIAAMRKTQRDRTLLISSPHFSYLEKIYDGNVVKSAALLQELSLPLIKSIDRQHGGKSVIGKSIIHTQDQFAGIITAYCKSRNMPTVHTLHNGFTYLTPYDYYTNVDLTDNKWGLKKYMYESPFGSNTIDSHATAVKNADIITFVGKRFYEEILEDRYKNWDIFATAQDTFNEVKIKAQYNQARVVMNGIASEELPEHQEYLVKKFSPRTNNIVEAKNENKLVFQEKMGLNKNKDAILLYWPSRINNSQKGIDSLIGCAKDILNKNKDVQIAIVGDAQNGDSKYLEKIKNDIIPNSPVGSIKHLPFDKKLSNLGYASSSAIIGASRYEPFGLFWLQGVCAGSFGIGAENGGAVDILREFNSRGNGFLYKDTDATGLKYGIENAINTIRQLNKNPELYIAVLRDMMTRARYDFSQCKMVEGYLKVYDEAASRHNLFTKGYKPFTNNI